MHEEHEEDDRGPVARAREALSPAAVGRILIAQADFVGQLTKREQQHDAHDGHIQTRLLTLYDEIGRLHGALRDKDREISDLRRDDRDLKAEEIKADVERRKIQAREEAVAQLFEFMGVLAKELPSVLGKQRYGGGTPEEQSYAQALWCAVGALIQALEKDPSILERIQAVAPEELIELVKVLKSYKTHTDNKRAK